MLVCDYLGVRRWRDVETWCVCVSMRAWRRCKLWRLPPPDGSYNERFNTCCGVVRVVFLPSGRCAGYMCGGFCGVRYAGGGRSHMPGPTPVIKRELYYCAERERVRVQWAFFLPESGARAERALCSLVMVKPTPLFKILYSLQQSTRSGTTCSASHPSLSRSSPRARYE